VVDIPAATLESERVLPEGQGFVKQLRAAAQPNGDLRVVVDLTGPAQPKTFTVGPQQSYGHRLVLDLTPSKGTVAAAPSQPSVVKAVADAHGRDIIIAIDAGHGGVDPGSVGKRGTYEKHVTLAIAKRLKERIDREPGMRAVLTRDNDTYVDLRDRIVRARKQQADMFVSVHADSYTNRSVAGSSVYVLSARGASDESARWLADRENAADLIGGVKLDDKDSVLASVLLDLSQGASMSASVDAAELVMQELYKIGNITNRGVKHAGFIVLKSPDIPSMLVETAFISNPTEEARLLDPKHQQRLAEAIHQGVRAYFYTNPPPGTLVADLRAKQSSATVIASTADGESAGSTAH
jgi:N-acetylmuramoyl-L-alanine amidase